MSHVETVLADVATSQIQTGAGQRCVSAPAPAPVESFSHRRPFGKRPALFEVRVIRYIRGFGWYLLMIVLGWAVLVLAGCAGTRAAGQPAPAPEITTPAVSENKYWWAYRLRVAWPPKEPADMTIDLMLAHAVVKPSLDIFAQRLSYWRFHRRAARDAAGHQFSLLFYANPSTAQDLYASLQASPSLKQLRAQGLVTGVIMDDPAKPVRPGIADTSDPKWPPMLQRQWPAYIMGVSALWLGLVDEAVATLPPDQHNGADRLAAYRAAEKRVTAIWFKNGQHAFLHHLSAVFGYRELLIVQPIRF